MPSGQNRIVAKVSALAPSLYAAVGAVVAFLLGLRMIFGTLASCLPFGCKGSNQAHNRRRTAATAAKKAAPAASSAAPAARASTAAATAEAKRSPTRVPSSVQHRGATAAASPPRRVANGASA